MIKMTKKATIVRIWIMEIGAIVVIALLGFWMGLTKDWGFLILLLLVGFVIVRANVNTMIEIHDRPKSR